MPKGINNEISHSTYTIYHKSRRIEGLDTKAVSNCVYIEAHFNSVSFDRILFFHSNDIQGTSKRMVMKFL